MEKTYYFAYGSNLWMEQMAKRCPSSIPIERAILRDHQLIYRSNSRGRGVADVVPKKGGKVHGAIYEVTPEDVRQLDKYEGVKAKIYKQCTVTVEGKSGETECIVYMMYPHFKLALPNKDYFKKIYRGYKDWVLPEDYLVDEFKKFKTRLNNKIIIM